MRRKDREITDRAELKAILTAADSCHLALVDAGAPYLVTLNFGFVWEEEFPVLYFHCAHDGRKAAILKADPRVCWSVDVGHELVLGDEDSHCTMRYQSLVGTGTVTFVTDPAEKKLGLDRIMGHYSTKAEFRYPPQVVDQTTVLRLDTAELTGKKRT